jgi:hypothetical protein
MMYWKSAAAVSALALGLALAPAAQADQWNLMTRMTFSQPVEVPGVVLPAGTYVFKLLNSEVDRNVVQIFNKRQDHLYATILTIPDYRLRPTSRTVVMFEERQAGSPEAIRTWFYPGESYGNDFVYPKVRAVSLAKAVNQPVASMPTETGQNITKPITSAKAPEVAQMLKAPITVQQPNGEETPAPQAPAETAQVQPAQKLPKTASNLPLTGMLGTIFLGLAGVVRLARKHAA